MTCYRRTIITGTLTTKSNLHIGSGEERSLADEKEDSPNQEQGSLNVVVRSKKGGQPYIPASSLRGFLRSQIIDPALRQALFGLARQKAESVESGNAGQLRLYDASLQKGQPNLQQISRTSIDPLTQTAKEHCLLSYEVIPPGVSFELTLELDHSAEAEIQALLQALTSLGEETLGGQLGKGKSIGQGRMVWKSEKILGLTEESLKAWLQPPLKEQPNNKRRRGKAASSNKSFSKDANFISEFDDLTKTLALPLLATTDSGTARWKTIAFDLKAHSPVLINDPQRVKQRQQEQKKREAERKAKGEEPPEKKETTPDLIYMLHQERACIPGSTLKGWLRGHCRRILLTILGDAEEANEKRAESLLAELFGSTDQGRGLLQFEDALANIDPDRDKHPQTFIAVDRFTGGAKSSALYNVEAIWPKQPFNSELHYRNGELKGWMKILLLYALRDAMEGDLVLGWGKSRGYGRLTLESTGIALGNYSEGQLKSWQAALQERLQQEQTR